MRTNGKKISAPAKEKKQPAKLKAKRSRQSLLQSAPAETQVITAQADSGAQRWLFGLAGSALVLATLALLVSSDLFRSRSVVQPPVSTTLVSIPNDQKLPAVQTALIAPPARAEQSAPAFSDPEADARNDYMLALATGTTDAIDIFLKRYPGGFHADLARVQRNKFAEFELPGIIKNLNSELKRVGCGPAGTAEWTAASEQALVAFNRHAQTSFNAKMPDASALKAVKDRTDRVCPAPPVKAAQTPPPPAPKNLLFFWQ